MRFRIRAWKQSSSLAWRLKGDDDDLVNTSADDVPYARAIGDLDEHWAAIAPTTDILFDTLASWCGCWYHLLHAR
ncbi:hypothetical protein DIPPA_12281 [Diplonema papillatum]|nr:hypothetical protein DIPPA_12281 [Diplonema papillatum]